MVLTEYTPPIIPTRFGIKLSALYFLTGVAFALSIFGLGMVIQNNSFQSRIDEFERKTYNQLVESSKEKDELYRENIAKIRELQNGFDAINKKLQIVSNKIPIVTDSKGIIVTNAMSKKDGKDVILGYNVTTLYQTAIKKYPKRQGDWSHENFIRTIAVENTSFNAELKNKSDDGLCQINRSAHKDFYRNLEKIKDREKVDFYIDYCLAVWNDGFKKKVMPRRGHYSWDHTKTTKQIRIAEQKRNLFKFSSIENKSLDIVSDFNNNI